MPRGREPAGCPRVGSRPWRGRLVDSLAAMASNLTDPTPQQLRRALVRAERGAALDLDEATVLLAARGADLDRLTAAAARVRDAGLVAAGRLVDGRGVVTYSPKVFIPVTRLC